MENAFLSAHSEQQRRCSHSVTPRVKREANSIQVPSQTGDGKLQFLVQLYPRAYFFVNKVLLEHRHAHLFMCAIREELNCNRDQ